MGGFSIELTVSALHRCRCFGRQPRQGGGWDDGLVSMPIRIAILGATGSIGRQALDVVRAQPDRLRVVALGANRNADALRELAMEFPTARTVLGSDALVALATDLDADLVLIATPG